MDGMLKSNSSEPNNMDTQTKDDKKTRTKLWYNAAKRIAVVAGVLAGILSVLMVANYFQTKSVDPLNSPAITQLMTRLRENPEDTALMEQIRALDLLARKAYFTHQWQIRTGSYLLFAFVLVCLLALKFMSSLEPRLPDLGKNPESGETWGSRLLSRKYLLYGGLSLVLLAFVLGVISQTELKKIGLARPEKGRGDTDFATIKEMRNNWPGFRGPEGIGWAYHTDVPAEWDGASGKWVDVTPVGTKPSARGYHAMAYDSVRERIFLYGGYDDTNLFQDSWELMARTWVEFTLLTST